jgi:hypothetical protein
MRPRSSRFRDPLATPLAVLVATLVACGGSDGGSTRNDGGQTSVAGRAADAAVVVNGRELSAEVIRQLQQLYPVSIPAGRYWYDSVSGVYGREGEPVAGQMLAGLSLGPLDPNASRGTSAVFINGRQITVGEKAYIEQMCQTPVAPARYWIIANGIGGFEGGPALFNMAQCPGFQQQSSGPRSMSRTWCDGNGACTSTGILGSILTAPR